MVRVFYLQTPFLNGLMKREDLRQGLQGSHKYGSVDEWRMLAVEDFKE